MTVHTGRDPLTVCVHTITHTGTWQSIETIAPFALVEPATFGPFLSPYEPAPPPRNRAERRHPPKLFASRKPK